MSFKLKDIVGDIFHTEEKEKANEEKRTSELQQKLSNTLGISGKSSLQDYNPFLKRNGELVNPFINYQKLLDNPKVNNTVKSYIQKATGLTPKLVVPTVEKQLTQEATDTSATSTPKKTTPKGTATNPTTTTKTNSVGTGAFKDRVGQRITDTSKYSNGAAKGQCVWYVLGRASERNGKNITIGGNGNTMYYNAKEESKLSATPENLKGNTLLSYNKGTSNAGQKYGHVIFIEDVVGDTVYYTEGGSGYYKNGTDGVVKTATKEQILQGVNSAGSRIGSEPVGLIDLSKY